MNRRVAARLAWSLWALSTVLTILSLWLLVLNSSHSDVPVYTFWAENVLFSVGFSTVGAVIVSRMLPENSIGWLFCAVGFLWAMIHFVGEYAIYTLIVAPGSLPAGEVASWLYCWPWVFGLGLLVFLGLLFPNGRLPGARWRWFARFSALSTLAGMVLAAFSTGQMIGLPGISNPLGIEGLPNAYKPVQVLMFVLITGTLVSLLMRRMYARGIERQQTRWFTYATGIATGGVFLQYIISEPLELVFLGWVGYALVLIGIAGLPISMGIAVTRYRLYDIDVIVNRTLVYGALTVSLALVYFGGVTATQAIFRALTGQEEQTQLAVVASTLVIAALFTPLRRRIQAFIDRRFYRNNYDARKTLEAFSATLRDETDLDRLGEGLVRVVGETMQPAHVDLWLRPEGGPGERARPGISGREDPDRVGNEGRETLKGTLRKSPIVAVIAVVISLLLVACSSEGSHSQPDGSGQSGAERGGQAKGSGTEGAKGGSPNAAGSETPAALVPIAHLGSTVENVSLQELSGARGLAVGREYREEAAGLVGDSSFEDFASGDAVIDHVSRTPDVLGLVPWDEVGPEVKALSVDGNSLFDSEGSGDYPLRPDGATVPDPEKLRSVVVGGDIVLDRGQYYTVIQQGRGIDFPLDGGYAAVTSRAPEPSAYSETGTIHQFTAQRTGRAGAMREYLSGADLTLANLENPVIKDAVYHPDSTTFTGHLRLMPILDQAGLDGVTLGNNHILDAGTTGIGETIRHLDEAGIAHAGAGKDLAEARKPMIFDLGGTKIGVLSYMGVPSYDWAWATESAPGTAPLLENIMREDIERLRPRVDLVLVMPHWGKEYIATPEPGQVDFAHAAMDAGADLFIGGHAHWPKGMEMYEGKPIFYGVGNFLLDQSWSEETSTAIFAETTLYGDDVVQARPVPFIILDNAQPNFLVPEAGGDRALRKVFAASLGPEFEAYGNRTR